MRLPAIAIASAFCCGIAVGLHPAIAAHSASHLMLTSVLLFAALLILAGLIFAALLRLFPAGCAGVMAWTLLGISAALIAQQPRAHDHVVSLIDGGTVDIKSPLRWHGQLRDEPARLPWGYGYEIELSGVEVTSNLLPARGGLRLSFTATADQPVSLDLHCGDTVAVLAQAKQPQVFRDEGAFDRRAYLATQGVDLVATLRSAQLVERVAPAERSLGNGLARGRRSLREEIDRLYAPRPEIAGVLRAMLLGDRTFVDRSEAVEFQKTGVFHVLVVAGLHVGAIAFLPFWIGRRLRLSPLWTIGLTLLALALYVSIVEQRAPVLRAALMCFGVVMGGYFFRRLELLNSLGVAAILLLAAKPSLLKDSSFQLSFLAIGCIAGIGLPWLRKTVEPYAHALRGWRDVTRDAAHEPRAAQFRIDLRSVANWLAAKLPRGTAGVAQGALVGGMSVTFRVWELLVISFVLQVGMLPLMARDFHRITITGPLTNLAAVPLVGALVPLGFITLIVGAIVPPIARAIAVPLGWLTVLMLKIVHWFGQFSVGSYRIPGPPVWVLVAFLAAMVGVALALRLANPWSKRVGIVAVCTLGGAAIVVATYPFAPQWSKGKLELTVLDVGQGDSLLVVSQGGRTLLIDGGGAFGGFPGHEEHGGIDPGEDAVSPYLWSRGFRKIDSVALTHAHQDHIGGLMAILTNFRVGELWIGREVRSEALARLEDLVRSRGITIRHELRGLKFDWDGASGTVLWPEIPPDEIGPSAKNNDSLVLRMQYGATSLLLPGDAEKEVERAILEQNAAEHLRADVLKVGHHGSKNSTTAQFLDAVNPRVAIISAGEDNPYGHPTPELLDRLRNVGAWILRTDRNGAIHVLTNGHTLEITCFVACSDESDPATSVRAQTPNQQQNHKNE